MSIQNSPSQPPNQYNIPPYIHLPTEIILRILYYAVLPPPLCPLHLFGKCIDPWSCPYGPFGHIDTVTHPQALTPSPSLTSVSHLFHHEAHKLFYAHNNIIFSPCNNSPNNPPTRLLSFNKEPSPAMLQYSPLHIISSVTTQYISNSIEYPHTGEYRHLIKHLVLKTNKELMKDHIEDWDWPLKIAFRQTLPNLETLYLDFRAGLKKGDTGTPGLFRSGKLFRGAERMRNMKLKKLVLVGLCSHEYRNEYWHDLAMKLFKPALGEGGELLLLDEDHI